MSAETVTVDPDWTPPSWLSKPGFTKRELQWLCARLDQTNRELRIEVRELRLKLGQESTTS